MFGVGIGVLAADARELVVAERGSLGAPMTLGGPLSRLLRRPRLAMPATAAAEHRHREREHGRKQALREASVEGRRP